MTEEQPVNPVADEAVASEATAATAIEKRERSTIQFPYNDLDDAVTIVKAIHEHAGLSCTIDQLAAYQKQSMTSGAFRLRVGNAAMFGLTVNERGQVSLTDLGRRISDPEQEASAKAEAFLEVPLYRLIHDHFKGYQLPPTAALERFMRDSGVSPKQTDKARHAFQRSARQAGYFVHGEDRLVRPAGPGTRPTDRSPETETSAATAEKTGGGGGGVPPGPTHHPFIEGLIRELPKTGDPWPAKKQELWLDTARSIFKMIYPAAENEEAAP